MTTTGRYLTSTKNLPSIMDKIVVGTAPDKFNAEHLKGLGFQSSNDRAVIPLLKDLGFLTADGVPTKRYHQYRDKSQSKAVMAEALREAYPDIFHINARPTATDRNAIQGRLKSIHNTTDSVAEKMATTFYALLNLSNLDASPPNSTPIIQSLPKEESKEPAKETSNDYKNPLPTNSVNLNYDIEIHLPATKDIEVYNAIFKSIREHLLQ